jgi:hypothetical protein
LNSLEDRLHTFANHLDDELRSTATKSNASQTRDSELTSNSELVDPVPPARVRLRTVTLVSVVLVLVACLAAGVVLSRRDDSSNSGAPGKASAPSPFDGGVALIVYMRNGAPADEIDAVRAALVDAADLVDATRLEYLDIPATLAEAQRLFVDDPASLAFLTADNVPSMFKVIPAPGATSEQLVQFSQTLASLPGVLRADTPNPPITEEPNAATEGTTVVATIFDEEPAAPSTDHP